MIENTLTPLEEAFQKYKKVGVVAFIFDHESRVLVLQENNDKKETGRRIGDLSVLCETGEPGESWGETLIRGVNEELKIPPDLQREVLGVDANSYLGETLFVEHVLARVVSARFTGDTSLLDIGKNFGEVTVVGWENPNTLVNYPLRPGVKKVLSECLEKRLLEGNFDSNLWPFSLAYLKIIGG